ncbi:MAG: hypothetical protein L0G53_13615, partial [Acinetobacter sp.]
ADSNLRSDLFRTPLQSKIAFNLFPYSEIYGSIIRNMACFSQFVSMLGKVAIYISIAFDLPGNSRGSTGQSAGNMTCGKTFTS